MSENKNIPDVVIDVDGVILDFANGFSTYFNNVQDKMIVAPEPHLWDYGLEGDDLTYFKKHITEYVDSSPHLEILDKGWSGFTKRLCDKYNVHIMTAFHNQNSRKNNLNHYDIKYHDIHFTVNVDKAEYVAKHNPKIVIEDCPTHVNKLTELLPNAKILVPKRWDYVKNQVKNHENIIFFETVEELEKKVFDLLK